MKIFNRYLYIILAIYTAFLICHEDLWKSNLSGMSYDSYFAILLMGILMMITYMNVIKRILDKKDAMLFVLSIILAIYLPYNQDIIILMNMHIISCYIGFAILNYIIIKIIIRYKIYNYQKYQIVKFIYFMSLLMIFAIYTYSLCVNGLMELIFLEMISLIFGIIEYDL